VPRYDYAWLVREERVESLDRRLAALVPDLLHELALRVASTTEADAPDGEHDFRDRLEAAGLLEDAEAAADAIDARLVSAFRRRLRAREGLDARWNGPDHRLWRELRRRARLHALALYGAELLDDEELARLQLPLDGSSPPSAHVTARL
jgi:hypothetical protein